MELSIRVTFDDVFNFAEYGCRKTYENEPEIQKEFLSQIEKLHFIYKQYQSDEMKALRKLNKIKPTGRKRSGKMKPCPKCQEDMKVIKNGQDKKHRQRYRCNACGITFY